MNLGINLTGAEYGLLSTSESINYFAAQGFTTIRLPLTWEHVQTSLYGALDQNLMQQVHAFVDRAEAQGLKVIIDLHNYASYQGHLIGSAQTPISAFADVWSKIAGEFKADGHVSYGLMNEPQVATATEWLPAVNAAIDAIRHTGATQQILVPGTYWDGAWSWTTTDNASVLGRPGAIVDSAHNYAFEVHQYLDDTSGQHDWVVSETIGVERLRAVTDWARETGSKLYLGEFGVAANHTSLVALSNMLNFVEQNADVWQGASYFAAGVGWQDYMYAVEPNLGLLDMPQMAVLKNYLDTRTVSTVLADKTVELDTYVDGRNKVSIKDILDDAGNLLSRTLYDVDGHATRSVSVGSDGHYDLTIYASGSDVPSTLETYDHGYHILSRTILGTDGAKTVTFFGAGEWDVRRVETYTAGNHLSDVQQVDGAGNHVYTIYSQDHVARIETFDAHWQFVERKYLDAAGHVTQIQTQASDGHNTIVNYDASGARTSSATYDTAWQMEASAQYAAGGILVQTTTTLAGGQHQFDTYRGGTTVVQSVVYDSKSTLLSKTSLNADGTQTKLSYSDGTHLSSSEVLDGTGHVLSRTAYDAQGRMTEAAHNLADGGREVAAYTVPGASHPSYIDTFDAHGRITSRAQVDSSGAVTAIDHVAADGSHRIETFRPGSTIAATSETYDSHWKLESRTSFDAQGHVTRIMEEKADGSHVFLNYDGAAGSGPTSIDTYGANWQITARYQLDNAGRVTAIDHIRADGSHLVESFQPGSAKANTSEIYDASWKLQSRTSYDSSGAVVSVLHEEANGTHAIAAYATPGSAHPATIDRFDANWSITDRVHLDRNGATTAVDHLNQDGTHSLSLYVAGSQTAFETDTFQADWSLLSVQQGTGTPLSAAVKALVAEFDLVQFAPAAPVVAAPAHDQHDMHAVALTDVFSAGWALA